MRKKYITKQNYTIQAFATGLSGIAYALLKYKMPKLTLLIGVEGIYDRNEV